MSTTITITDNEGKHVYDNIGGPDDKILDIIPKLGDAGKWYYAEEKGRVVYIFLTEPQKVNQSAVSGLAKTVPALKLWDRLGMNVPFTEEPHAAFVYSSIHKKLSKTPQFETPKVDFVFDFLKEVGPALQQLHQAGLFIGDRYSSLVRFEREKDDLGKEQESPRLFAPVSAGTMAAKDDIPFLALYLKRLCNGSTDNPRIDWLLKQAELGKLAQALDQFEANEIDGQKLKVEQAIQEKKKRLYEEGVAPDLAYLMAFAELAKEEDWGFYTETGSGNGGGGSGVNWPRTIAIISVIVLALCLAGYGIWKALEPDPDPVCSLANKSENREACPERVWHPGDSSTTYVAWTYFGEWEVTYQGDTNALGQPEGEGKAIYNQGANVEVATYEGSWKAGLKEGKGTLVRTYTDGTRLVIQGSFSGDEPLTSESLFLAWLNQDQDTTAAFEGTVEPIGSNNMPSGKGTFYPAGGRRSFPRYEGEILEGKAHDPNGTYYTSNNKSRTGHWIEGTFQCPNQ